VNYNILILYLNGECRKNLAKNNLFLYETGDKKSVSIVYKAFFWQVTNIFFMLFEFSASRALAASSATFGNLPKPDLITTRG
jgi:hypothetical protein